MYGLGDHINFCNVMVEKSKMIHWIINHIKAHTLFCLTSCGYQFRIYLCYNYGYYYSLEPLIKVVLFWIDNNSQFEEDELLARAIQECLNVESPPIYNIGNKYQPVPVYYSMGYKYIICLMDYYIVSSSYIGFLGTRHLGH